MPDTNTQNLNDPQASVDAALGNLNPSTPTAAPTTPAAAAVPMGDDTPLAFAGATLSPLPETKSAMPTPTASPILDTPPVVEPAKVESPITDMGSSYLPPAPSMTTSAEQNVAAPKKKSKVLSIVLGLFVLFGALGAGGYYYYSNFMVQKPQIAILDVSTAADCKGCSPDGFEWKWHSATNKCSKSNISCVDSADGTKVTNPSSITNETACKANPQGQWCSGTDINNNSYGFCMNNNGTEGNCNSQASSKGFVIQLGSVECVNCNNQGVCDVSSATLAAIDHACKTVSSKTCTDNKTWANNQCQNKVQGIEHFLSSTTETYICKIGVKGDGGVVYSGGPCNATNGTVFKGNLSCFCGTIQRDTSTGHQSYSSSCGCNNSTTITESHKACNTTTKVCETVTGPGANTCTTDANCVTAAPVLACTGLTQTPATTPAIGEKVTFTCAGSITPAGAATLSYKFRYSLDSGADQLLPNKTATTAELTIAACGTYSVQCKVCATIGGVLKCDPTWTGAIQ